MVHPLSPSSLGPAYTHLRSQCPELHGGAPSSTAHTPCPQAAISRLKNIAHPENSPASRGPGTCWGGGGKGKKGFFPHSVLCRFSEGLQMHCVGIRGSGRRISSCGLLSSSAGRALQRGSFKNGPEGVPYRNSSSQKRGLSLICPGLLR